MTAFSMIMTCSAESDLGCTCSVPGIGRLLARPGHPEPVSLQGLPELPFKHMIKQPHKNMKDTLLP